MNLTVLKIYFTKEKHDAIFYRNYKKLDYLKFKKALNRQLTRHGVNNINSKIFHEILEILEIFQSKCSYFEKRNVKLMREKILEKRCTFFFKYNQI